MNPLDGVTLIDYTTGMETAGANLRFGAEADALRIDDLRRRLVNTRVNHCREPKPTRLAAIAELERRVAAAQEIVANQPRLAVLVAAKCAEERAAGERRLEAEHAAEAEYYAYRAWVPGARRRVQAALRRAGFKRSLTSSSGSNYYTAPDGLFRVRLADHDLPIHAERAYNWERGWRCCEREIVLDRRMNDEELAGLIDEMVHPEAEAEDDE